MTDTNDMDTSDSRREAGSTRGIGSAAVVGLVALLVGLGAGWLIWGNTADPMPTEAEFLCFQIDRVPTLDELASDDVSPQSPESARVNQVASLAVGVGYAENNDGLVGAGEGMLRASAGEYDQHVATIQSWCEANESG